MNIDVLKSIDFKRLQIFLTVTECQGFSLAQDKLGISSASISLHMSELEKKLGMVLCKRGRSGFSLTPEGEKIYKASQSLLLAHAEFNSIVGETKGMLEGELNIGLIDQLVFDDSLDIPAFLDDIQQLAPQLKVSMFTMSPAELTSGILSQNLHLAVGVFYEQFPLLNYQKICDERLTLYCGKHHRLFDKDDSDVSIFDIRDEKFVERTFGETLPIANTPLPLKPDAYSSSLEATLLFILSGNYIGFLSDYYASYWVARGFIKPLLDKKVFADITVMAITHQTPEDSVLSNMALNTLIKRPKKAHLNS